MKTGWIHTTEQSADVRFAPKTIVTQILMSENGPDLLTAINQMFLDRIYPIGSIYLSASSVSPASFLGGTWERIENKALVAQGDIPATGNHLAYNTSGDLECLFIYAWKRLS